MPWGISPFLEVLKTGYSDPRAHKALLHSAAWKDSLEMSEIYILLTVRQPGTHGDLVFNNKVTLTFPSAAVFREERLEGRRK